MRLRWLVSLMLLLPWFVNSSQAQCIDPLSISPGFACPDPSYNPVCGCDGVTYRHACEARYRNGVLYYSEGPCSGLEFDIIPTMVGPNDNLIFTFAQNKGITATLYIIDYFGKVVHQQFLPAMDNYNPPYFQLSLDVGNYRNGVYIIAITNSKGDYRYKKFVKY